MGNFFFAIERASAPNIVGASETSKITRPGRIGKIQLSTAPRPLPIRTAKGFLVIDVNGKTCACIVPLFLNFLLKTFLAASKCEDERRPELVAFK